MKNLSDEITMKLNVLDVNINLMYNMFNEEINDDIYENFCILKILTKDYLYYSNKKSGYNSEIEHNESLSLLGEYANKLIRELHEIVDRR